METRRADNPVHPTTGPNIQAAGPHPERIQQAKHTSRIAMGRLGGAECPWARVSSRYRHEYLSLVKWTRGVEREGWVGYWEGVPVGRPRGSKLNATRGVAWGWSDREGGRYATGLGMVFGYNFGYRNGIEREGWVIGLGIGRVYQWGGRRGRR